MNNRFIIFSFLVLFLFSFNLAWAEEINFQNVQERAENGEAMAQIQLGLLYANGEMVEQSFADAKQWWEKAAAQDNPEAQYYIGFMHFKGAGVELDLAKAKEWWEKSAEKEHVPALFNLGLMYVQGEAVQGSYEEAGRYFTRAAELGSVQAQFNVSMLYHKGLGYPQNNVEGYAWAKLAADRKHPSAFELVVNLEKNMDDEQLALAKMRHAELKKQIGGS